MSATRFKAKARQSKDKALGDMTKPRPLASRPRPNITGVMENKGDLLGLY